MKWPQKSRIGQHDYDDIENQNILVWRNIPPQSEPDSNFPGDDSETWSPTSEKQVSIQKLFIWHHNQITNW